MEWILLPILSGMLLMATGWENSEESYAECSIQGSWVHIFQSLQSSDNPKFCFHLHNNNVWHSYLIHNFPCINPLDTVMYIQMLNNDYAILETGIYCQALVIVGRSAAYSQVSILVKTYPNLLWEKACTHIYSFFNPKSSRGMTITLIG